MFGCVPVRFASDRSWYVDIGFMPVRVAVTAGVRGLLRLNATVEEATEHRVKLMPPLRRADGCCVDGKTPA